MKKSSQNTAFKPLAFALALLFLLIAMIPSAKTGNFSSSKNYKKTESILTKILKNINNDSFSGRGETVDDFDGESDTDFDHDFFIADFPLAMQFLITSFPKKEICGLKNTHVTDFQKEITPPPPKF